MSATLWKVTAIKKWNKMPQGVEVEIIVNGRSGQPNITEIRNAIENKYDISGLDGIPLNVFNIIKK